MGVGILCDVLSTQLLASLNKWQKILPHSLGRGQDVEWLTLTGQQHSFHRPEIQISTWPELWDPLSLVFTRAAKMSVALSKKDLWSLRK